MSDILKVVIPHFTNYPLQYTKLISYYLFKKVAFLMNNRDHLTLGEYNKILAYKAS